MVSADEIFELMMPMHTVRRVSFKGMPQVIINCYIIICVFGGNEIKRCKNGFVCFFDCCCRNWMVE